MSYDPKKLTQAVRDNRKAASLTQAELAEKAGLAFETISRVESGREPPSLRTAVALADALELALDVVVARGAPSTRARRAALAPDVRRLVAAAQKLEPRLLKHLVAVVVRLASGTKTGRL